jgi:hypothetical protein
LKSEATSDLRLTFALVTALAARFRFLTAPLRICADPTLFFGSVNAAYPVPPRATKSAMSATTSAGEGRRRVKRPMRVLL